MLNLIVTMRKQTSTIRFRINHEPITTTQSSCKNEIIVDFAGKQQDKPPALGLRFCQQEQEQQQEQPKANSLLSHDYFQIIENFKSEDKRPKEQQPQRHSYQEQKRLREQQQQQQISVLIQHQKQEQETEPQYAINGDAESMLRLSHKPVNEKESRNKLEENHDNYTDNVYSVNINNTGGNGGIGCVGGVGSGASNSRGAIEAISRSCNQHRKEPYSLMAPLKQQQIQQDPRGRSSRLASGYSAKSTHQCSIIAKSFLCLYILQQLASLVYYSIDGNLKHYQRLVSTKGERSEYHKWPVGGFHDGHRGGPLLLFALAADGDNLSPQAAPTINGQDGAPLARNRFDRLLESEMRLEESRKLVRPLDLIKQQANSRAGNERQKTRDDNDDFVVLGRQMDPQVSLPATETDHTDVGDQNNKHGHHKHHHNHHHHRNHHHNHHHQQHREKARQHQQEEAEFANSQRSTSGDSGDRIRRHNYNNNDYSDDATGGGGGGGYFDATSQNAADRPVVATRKGLIRGITRKSVTGKYVDAFLGIPFAQPPTGRFRFRHPRPINPWPGELDASKLSNSCYQVNDTFFGATFMGTSVWNANTPLNEDCLYLNVWTPFGVANTTVPSTAKNSNKHNNHHHPSPLQDDHESPHTMSGRARSSSSSSSSSISGAGSSSKPLKRAVLVWIFGGGFYSGTSSLALYDGSALASEEDIIVVSMNYRVSALGFLYFGRPDAPGNAGLFDQLMALQWINDNIDQFGGDPERVTLFGESAGAVSIAFHLLSPLSRNLFNQAIMQSGGATCPWGHMELPEIIANGLQLASNLNCPSNQTDLDSVLECLLRADPMSLVSQEVGQTRNVLNFPFVPVVDGSFLIEPPGESLAKANFKQARILLGSNFDEANAFLIYWPEFSHCPSSSSSSSSSGSQEALNTLAPSTSDSGTTSASSDLGGGAMNQADIDGATLLMGELRDQARPMTDEDEDGGQEARQRQQQIKSLDLVGPSGRQSAGSHGKPSAGSSTNSGQHQQSSGANDQTGPLNQQKQQQQQQQQHDREGEASKPCKPIELLSLTREDFFQVLREGLNPYAEHPIGKEAIIFEYSNWNNPQDPVSNYDAIDKIVGDYNFLCHVNEFAQRYAEAGNGVYMYYFRQHSSISPWPKWMGVLHGDEIYFIFGEPLNQLYNYTSKEVELSRRMMKYWANFAKFGDPTKMGDNTTMAEKWPEYGDKKQYFELHSDYIRIGRGPRAKQCAFWADYLPKLIQSFDKGGQCMAPGKATNSLLIHPFTSSSQLQLAHSRGSNYGHHQHNHQRHLSLFNSIPSGLLISLLVILILAGVAGAGYMICSRHSSATWKLKWPLGSSSTSSAPGNNGEGGAGATSRGAGQSADPSD